MMSLDSIQAAVSALCFISIPQVGAFLQVTVLWWYTISQMFKVLKVQTRCHFQHQNQYHQNQTTCVLWHSHLGLHELNANSESLKFPLSLECSWIFLELLPKFNEFDTENRKFKVKSWTVRMVSQLFVMSSISCIEIPWLELSSIDSLSILMSFSTSHKASFLVLVALQLLPPSGLDYCIHHCSCLLAWAPQKATQLQHIEHHHTCKF